MKQKEKEDLLIRGFLDSDEQVKKFRLRCKDIKTNPVHRILVLANSEKGLDHYLKKMKVIK